MGFVRRAGRILAATVVFAAFAGLQQAEAQWTWTPQTGRLVNQKRMPRETPELQVEYARSLMLEGDYKKALRETDKFSQYYNDTEWADDNQFLRGEIREAQGNWLDAAKEYQQVVTGYPGSDLFDQVIDKQYTIGDYLFARGQDRIQRGWWRPFRRKPLKQAIEVYGMVIANQPFTNAAAEAQYKVGQCRFVLEQYVEAAYEYQRVIEDYATSEWVDEACHGLVLCYEAASLPPAYDQTSSQLAINAVDDFKARFPADPRNEELAPIRAEMRERIGRQRAETARFYEKRRKFDAARTYYEVTATEFSETEAGADARDWLSADAVTQAGGAVSE
jgi:outer membrane protein assembly factor BamD